MPNAFTLNLQREHRGWARLPKLADRLDQVATMVMAHLPKKLQRQWEVTVLLTGDEAVRALNHDFRGMDKPTNVLSFPAIEPREIGKKPVGKAPFYLGDMALSYPYMVAEAKKDHKILINHTIHLFIHGLLHLFGYDHLSDHEARMMEKLEQKLMAKLGLPDPYENTAPVMEPIRGRPAKPRPKTKTRKTS